MLKDIKINWKTHKPTGVKSRGINFNLHPLIIKWLNKEAMVLKKQYEYDEAFNAFDEIEDKLNKPNVRAWELWSIS